MKFELEVVRAHHFERLAGLIKKHPEDFQVIERLPEAPSGEGEHLWVLLEKTGQNTQWVAKQLAQWAAVGSRDVSFAGLKDRQGITTQTFSLHLPGQQDPDLSALNIPGVRVLGAKRHGKKLRTGQLVGNHFSIRVRLSGDHREAVARQWRQITEHGVPNYFGPQRFGQQGNNVVNGVAWLVGQKKLPRHLHSIHLSAVRSWLFNKLLSARVEQQTWYRLLAGDFVQFTEGKTGFYCEQPDSFDIERVEAGLASPCASLPGKSRETFELLDKRESDVLHDHQDTIDALVSHRVDRHFRKLRLFIEKPELHFVDTDPVFSFFLPAGSFATAVMAEMFELTVQTGFSDWNE